MAISNVYKPGWRSRRRSRLSLVERAVPKLGRVTVPDNTVSAAAANVSAKPSVVEDEQPVNADHAADMSSSGASERDPEQVHDALTKRLAGSSPAVAGDQDELAADPDRPEDPADPQQARLEEHAFGAEPSPAGETTEAAAPIGSEPEAEIEPATDRRPDADQALQQPIAPPEQPETPDLHPPHPIASGHDDDDEPAREDSAPPLPDAIDGDIARPPALVKTRVKPADVDLDLEALVTSGLVDPRDRGRPLPANIDEVARALVRQALSDQSGWRDRIILVSSAREGRAKSMAAINFAFALTTINRHSVVLLDANMDGSGVGAYLGMADTDHPGLTTALCDNAIEIEDIALETSLDGLTLVHSGGFEDDILDRFASRRMLEILRFLTKDPHTLLVLDAPPILSSQEATVLSVIAGQVALVVEAGVTDENSINLALKRIGDRHNVSLVLSENSGVPHEEPELRPTPASQRLALPTPRRSSTRRRLRRAVASLIVAVGLGAGILAGIDRLPHGQEIAATSQQRLSASGFSAFFDQPSALQAGGER